MGGDGWFFLRGSGSRPRDCLVACHRPSVVALCRLPCWIVVESPFRVGRRSCGASFGLSGNCQEAALSVDVLQKSRMATLGSRTVSQIPILDARGTHRRGSSRCSRDGIPGSNKAYEIMLHKLLSAALAVAIHEKYKGSQVAQRTESEPVGPFYRSRCEKHGKRSGT